MGRAAAAALLATCLRLSTALDAIAERIKSFPAWNDERGWVIPSERRNQGDLAVIVRGDRQRQGDLDLIVRGDRQGKMTLT